MNTIKLNTIGEVVKKVESGGGGSGSGSTIEYRDVSGLDSVTRANLADEIAFMVKFKISSVVGTTTAKKGDSFIAGGTTIIAISTDLNAKNITIADSYNVVQTFKDVLVEHGWWEEYNSCPIITEEEFYS